MAWGAAIGSIVQAGADIWAGSMAARKQKAANNVAIWNAQQDRALQKEFAQSGIQWKVEDAKKAGIHPIYGLGAQTASYTPVNVAFTPETGLADGISRAGQSVGRAIEAGMAPRTKNDHFIEASQKLTLQKMGLENELLASQIRTINQPGTPPGIPRATQRNLLDGQGNTADISERPLERTVSPSGSPHLEPGAVSDVGWARTSTGAVPVPSKDVKERIEDNIFQEVSHFVRNNILPNLGSRASKPTWKADGANDWEWDYLRQEWRPVNIVPPPRPRGSRGNTATRG